MKKTLFRSIITISVFSVIYSCSDNNDRVYFTTGFKTGEVTEHSVIIWTRLCGSEKPLPVIHERKEAPFRSPLNYDENQPVDSMDGAVAGKAGEVRVIIKNQGTELSSEWFKATEDRDYTVKIPMDNLNPYTMYEVEIEARVSSGKHISTISGCFRTAPSDDLAVPVLLTSSSCQYFWDYDTTGRGFRIYDSMLKLKPDFYVQTGDYVYYDKPGPIANSVEKARYKWDANNAWPSLVDFFKDTPVYIEKDDHDMHRDDSYPGIEPLGELTFEQGLKIWYEQVPVTGKPYRTYRWGKDLQIWLVEGREFRSPNTEPDGPAKTIWGEEQKEWFVQTVSASDATFKLLFSPTPVVGPDREQGKNDNHSNRAFETEGNWLRRFLSTQKNMYVVNGDRHWQYVSVDDKTGVMEFSQGPASDSHAQGWDQDDLRPQHRFLRVKGGFLAVQVERKDDIPVIVFTHYDVDGKKVHEEIINDNAYE